MKHLLQEKPNAQPALPRGHQHGGNRRSACNYPDRCHLVINSKLTIGCNRGRYLCTAMGEVVQP